MARKTAVHTTNAELAAAEHRADERTDRQVNATPMPTGLMSLAEWRERRGLLPLAVKRDDGTLNRSADSLLNRATNAARLELRGASFSPDDRADVAAAIMADVLTETGGSAPRADSPRVTLTALCDRAKTLRRSLERQRARDDADAQAAAARYALTADALGIDQTPAEHVAIVGRSSVAAAERAALAAMDAIGLDTGGENVTDTPVFALFYVMARGESPEVCAAERGVSHGAWRVRQSRGAKLIHATYSASEVLARLTLGARMIDGQPVYVTRDDSREAGSRTRMLAPDWRDRADTLPCDVTSGRLSRAERVHHMTARKRRGSAETQARETAAALARIGRALSGDRRERPAAATSTLAAARREDRAA